MIVLDHIVSAVNEESILESVINFGDDEDIEMVEMLMEIASTDKGKQLMIEILNEVDQAAHKSIPDRINALFKKGVSY